MIEKGGFNGVYKNMSSVKHNSYIEEVSFIEKVFEHVTLQPNHDALVTDDSCISFEGLFQLILQGVLTLRKYKITEKSVVGISIKDETTHLIISLSLLALGAKQISLACHDTKTFRQELANFVGVTEIISLNKEYKLDGIELVLVGSSTFIKINGFFEKSSVIVSQPLTDEQVYLRTSGTSGAVGIVGLSQQQLAQQSFRFEDVKIQRLLKLASVEHNNGKKHRLFCVYQGGTNVFIKPGSLTNISNVCRKYKVTQLEVTRMHLSDLIYLSINNKTRFPAEIKVICAGSFVPLELRKEIRQKVTNSLFVRYGATEFGSIALCAPLSNKITGSKADIIKGVELEIIDGDKVLPSGVIGEVRIKGKGMVSSYFKNPEKSKKSFRNGWFYPGDLGCFQEDGSLILHSRKDDMMILNGVNVFPSEIEVLLECHPDVRIAVVVPILSKIHGDIPVAVVELKNFTKVSAAELKKFARDNLALKAPRKIIILSSIPYNKSGKVNKLEIMKLFQNKNREKLNEG